MRRGCCLGCLGVVVVLAAVFFYVGYYIGQTDMLTLARRNDTLAVAGDSPALWMRIDPNSPELIAVIDQGMEDFTGFFVSLAAATFPYEATLAFTPEPASELTRVVFAMSMRRLGGVLENRSAASVWRWWTPQRLDSAGLEQEGLWVVRSHMAITPAMADASEGKFTGAGDAPPAPEGGHMLEAVLDNRKGEAYYALAPLLLPPAEAGDLTVMPKVPLDHHQLASMMAHLHTAKLTANFVTPDVVSVQLNAKCPDEKAAEALLLLLFVFQDEAFNWLISRGVSPVGDFNRDGSIVSGDFALIGVQEPLVHTLQRRGGI